jgi:hypothetical protein
LFLSLPFVTVLLIGPPIFTNKLQTRWNVPSPPVHATTYVPDADELSPPQPQFD